MTTYQPVSEIAKEVRESLKKEFPECRFSVRSDYHSMSVSLMSAPVSPFSKLAQYSGGYENKDYPFDGLYAQLNEKHLDNRCNGYYLTNEAVSMLKKVVKIANKKNWDRSDIQSDYFDVGYYFDLEIGKWNKPFQVKGGK